MVTMLTVTMDLFPVFTLVFWALKEYRQLPLWSVWHNAESTGFKAAWCLASERAASAFSNSLRHSPPVVPEPPENSPGASVPAGSAHHKHFHALNTAHNGGLASQRKKKREENLYSQDDRAQKACPR